MPPAQSAAIPAAPRKTLLEWIEHDDGNTTGFPQPPCSAQAQALSAGVIGQSARVKMESGRVLTVKVLDARTVRAEI